jgi:hypothetical protein
VTLLLAAEGVEVNSRTEDSVMYLGQSLPVYLVGGQTPLFLAVEKGRVRDRVGIDDLTGYLDIVATLLSDPRVGIRCQDKDGSTVLDLAQERRALVKTEAMKKVFREIVDLLLPHFSGYDAQELDEETAKERRKEKEKLLRARISERKAEEEQKKLRENQELVDSFYPPLNPDLFSGKLMNEDFQSEFGKSAVTGDFSSVRIFLFLSPLIALLFLPTFSSLLYQDQKIELKLISFT